jgi:2-(1,2-epoxy-1,2-dihydrophenyl)acetyl-CoA isomerase
MVRWKKNKPPVPRKLNTPMEIEKVGHVGILTLNNPASLNTLDNEEDKLLVKLLTDMKEDLDIHVVVITGAGRAFSAGANVKDWRARELAYQEMGGRPPDATLVSDGTTGEFMALQDLQKPTIAMVNGLAVGQGADLAIACDMRVASDSAWFQWAYILNGIVPMDGGCWYLPRLVGKAKAMELLLTGDRVYADEALRLGIVNKVVPNEQLREATLELANKIANGPWNAVQMARMIVNSAEHDTLRESLDKAYLSAHLERETMAKGFIAKGEKKQADFSKT